jgi:hypothetical protein
MADKQEMQLAVTEVKVMEWISKGKTRQYCITKLQEDGMTKSAADHMYYGALKKLLPDPDLFTAYKQSLMQQNIDRLEQIVDNTISGGTGDKAIAIKAIDTLNKMCGVYGENSVTVANNKDGEQIIRIEFGK